MYEDILRRNVIVEYGAALIPQSIRPFPELPYALSFMVPLPLAVVEGIKNGPTPIYFHHYRTINAYLDRVALEIELDFRIQGYQAVYVPASQSQPSEGIFSLFPHKTAAHLAGLGGIGMNALFLSKKYGPAVRLATVFTDFPLPVAEIEPEDSCLECGACVRECPSGALLGTAYGESVTRDDIVDAKKCSIFMKNNYQDNGRGAVCGRCVAVCPLCK